jgi:hypothetical protein
MDAPAGHIHNPQPQLSHRAFIVGSLTAGFAFTVMPGISRNDYLPTPMGSTFCRS